MTFERRGAPIDRSLLAASLRDIVGGPVPRGADNSGAAALERVAVASATVEVARECLEEAVKDARETGASWLEIGRVLGITRQAAFQRFGNG